jgi:FtsP/CotA-like multicopper oxidase with cupredoxin domain
VTVAGVVVALVLAVPVLLGLLQILTPTPESPVALHMRGYFFYFGADTAHGNPTLRFTRGARVRFVLVNDEDTHVVHNFGIPALGVPCGKPMEPGERREVTVVMPDSTGSFAYTCCAHPGMGGRIVVANR